MPINDGPSSASTLTIPSSLDRVESDLASLVSGKAYNISVDLNDLGKLRSEVMLESSLVQWISTRWRLSINPDTFQIECTKNESPGQVLEHLASSAPGVILAMLPAGKVKGIDRKATAIFRERFFNLQNKWPDLALQSSAFLVCLDAFPKWLPAQLYSDALNGQVTSWDGYRSLVDNLIKSVAHDSDIRGAILERSSQISTIFFELFKNTHDHARFGVDGSVISDSIRGVYARFYPLDHFQHLTKLEDKIELELNPVDRYLRALVRPRLNTKGAKLTTLDLSGFLELSVFDTGPGMAAKWLGQDISNFNSEEQYEAVISCFGKGYSSSQTDSSRGFGLWRVLQQLRSLKGFIRIRTNRVHAFRQYAQLEDVFLEQHADGHETPKEKLFDWRRQYTTKPGEYPAVVGTLVSIVIPLGKL